MAVIAPLTREYDVLRLRAEFPVLQRRINGRALTYLDNGASAQQPAAVIEAITDYT